MKNSWTRLRWSAYIWGLVMLIGLAITPGLSKKLPVGKPSLLPAPFQLSALPPYPVLSSNTNLILSATSFASLDTASGQYLLGHNVRKQVPPASISKIMLAWLVRKQCPLDQVVTVGANFPTGTILGLSAGQKFSVRDLLYAALLPSANDAAVALAEGCFGSVGAAVQTMNDRAGAWHLKDTHFTNPTGLDEAQNYTSAADLARLADLVTGDPVISAMVGTKEMTISSVGGEVSFKLTNTNQLLGLLGVDGIKTGSTELAKQNLILSDRFNGHHIITVVLGSADRYTDSVNLLGELRRIYRWEIDGDRDFGTTLGVSDTAK